MLAKKKSKTYNTEDSPVVTDLSTSSAVSSLSRGERTGSRVLYCLWSYVPGQDPHRIDIVDWEVLGAWCGWVLRLRAQVTESTPQKTTSHHDCDKQNAIRDKSHGPPPPFNDVFLTVCMYV